MVEQTSSTTATAPARLAERLAAASERRFVGRSAELDLFRSALASKEPPFAVLHIYGPGGVGKTTLLDTYQRMAQQAGTTCARIDGRAVDPSPAGLQRALGEALGLEEGSAPLDAFAELAHVVLLIDTYERLAPIDGWLRETFLPELPANSLTVIAGRAPPAGGWRDDPGWGELLRVVPLRNLRPEESRAYLRSRGVPDEQQPSVLTFTHGHPLALSLVADLLALGDAGRKTSPVEDPDIIRVLLERFVQIVPSQFHRQALEICAHVRVTTEALLAEALEIADARELFDWLRDLSFIEGGPQGIFPHDLARDVLDADLRWRNPDDYRQLHSRVRRGIVRRIQNTRGPEQQQAFFDLLFLHRGSPIMRPFYEWAILGNGYAEPATPADDDSIIEIVSRHEGEDAADVVRYWIERQPQSFYAFRDTSGALTGFTCMLRLDAISDEDRAFDPALAPAAAFAQRYGPVRPGETMVYCRFALGRESEVTAESTRIWDLVSMINVVHWVTTPQLAWTFIAVEDIDHWKTFFHYIRQRHSPDAAFYVGDRQYHVFSHDWRAEPPLAWLDLMVERELATNLTPQQLETLPPPPLIVLSQPVFEEAVRQALRDYTKPAALASNPLLRSRLAADAAQGTPSAETLRQLLRDAAGPLAANLRSERLYRAINRTYFTPAPTQEQAAELLGIPFSTYRSHLTAGIERMTAWLWQRELYGPE
jgi:RecA/RadA recombinase